MDHWQHQEKFRGALLGVAVGDALGAPYEGRCQVDRAALERLPHDHGQLWYTNDTHMTLGVAESLVERRGFDGNHMAAVFVRNFVAEPWRGYGAGPPRVFALLQQGVPWDLAGQMLFGGAGSYGNGAAIRVAPVALLAFRDLDRVAELAHQAALITHTHALGVEGAVLQACAIAFLLGQPPHSLESTTFLQILRSYARAPCYGDKLERLHQLLPAADRHAVVEHLGNGVAADEAVPAALYAFLRSPDACAQLEDWSEAAQAVKTALERAPEWLRSPILYERLADYRLKHTEAIQAEGDRCLKEGQPGKALEQYAQALTIGSGAIDQRRQADLYSRVGCAQFDLEDFANARTNFVKAIGLYRDQPLPDPGGALGTVCRLLLRGARHYWAVDAEWKSFEDEAGTNARLQSDLAAARKSLAHYLDELYQLSAQSAESLHLLPVVTPVAVEIGQRLIPEGPDTDWPLFQTYLPEMRRRIQDEMGVRVPGTRIRGNETDMPPDSYLIMLDEIPLVMGTVKTSSRYSPTSPEALRAAGIPEEVLEQTPHPLTGEPGCWIQPGHWELSTSKGFELWAEPLVYIVYHLEAVLCRNLADFLGLQEVENLLEVWGKSDRGSSLIKTALPDQISRLRFARVLRTLVRERVPITASEDILETVQVVGLASDDVSDVVRAVRVRLKRSLPANTRVAKRLDLPPETEDKIIPWIWHENSQVFFAIPPEETQELLSEIRALVDSADKNLVLVTHRPEVRPFVRRLVELEFPDLMVTSPEELLSQDELQEPARERRQMPTGGAHPDA